MKLFRNIRRLFKRQRGQFLREQLDSVVSGIVGLFISIAILLGVILPYFEGKWREWSQKEQLGWGAFTLWGLAVEGWFIIASLTVFSRRAWPYALTLAQYHPRIPLLLRLPLALWWLYHFMMGMFFGVMVALAEENAPFWAMLLLAAVAGGFGYLTYGYGLLVVKTLTNNSRHISRMWGWRKQWAATHALVVTAVKLYHYLPGLQ